MVLNAREVLAPVVQSRACGRSAQGQSEREHLFPPGEMLSAVLSLMALKILSHSGSLARLHGRGHDRDPSQIRLNELSHLVRQLHERHSSFCPEQPALAAPVLPSPNLLEAVWELLSNRRLSLHWSDERSLGYAYQFLCAPLRRASQNDIQSANKSVGSDQLIAFTQLYTPGWVVDYLLDNTVLPQWSGSPSTVGSNYLQIGWSDPSSLETIVSGGFPGQPSSRDRDSGRFDGKHTRPAAELALIDPACGSGHFLIPAFDLFLKMHAAEGTPPDEAVARILERNLAGVDIDHSALWVVALALLLKSLKAGATGRVEWRGLASVLTPSSGGENSLLGTLDPSWSTCRHHPLSRRYDAVVTNPPYAGRKLLPRDLKARLKALYPHAHQDLCAAFIQCGLDLVEPGGRLGFIAQASLLHLPTYQDLRQRLVEQEALISVVDAGPGVFPLQTGEKVNSALVVVERSSELPSENANSALVVAERSSELPSEKANSPLVVAERSSELPSEKANSPLVVAERSSELPSENSDSARMRASAGRIPAIFIDLTSSKDKESALRDLTGASAASFAGGIYRCDPQSFKLHPRYAFAYKCPPVVLRMVQSAERLDAHADVRQGLATTDNKRFVRYWWDVDPAQNGIRWFPYVKGAGSDRWYSPILHVVNWADNGAEIKAAVSDSYPYLEGKSGWVVKNEQFYFQDGLTFSFVNARALAVRRLPAGCIFDVGGSALFGDDETLDFLFAYLNSSVISAIARVLNPTINFQVGDVRRLPVIPFPRHVRDELAQLGLQCYRLKRELHKFNPTSIDAVIPQEVLDIASGGDISRMWGTLSSRLDASARALADLESRLNDLVQDGFLNLAGSDASTASLNESVKGRELKLSGSDSSTAAEIMSWINKEGPRMQVERPFSGPTNFAEVLVEFLVRLALEKGSLGWNRPATCQAPGAIEDVPVLLPTADIEELCRLLGLTAHSRAWLEEQLDSSITRYLLDRFMPSHARRFHGSPLYVCVRLPQNKSILLASSRVIRQRNSMLSDPTAQAIIDDIAEQLATIPDWTGADLVRTLGRTVN